MYGTTLRLSGDFYDPSVKINYLRLYVEKLREHMRLLKPKETSSHSNNPVFVHKNLKDCSHVFVRDRICGSLQPPYDGPYPVMSRKEKYFHVLIDRIKTKLLVLTEPASITSSSYANDSTEKKH